MRFVGIDVGYKELVVIIIANGKMTKPKTFENTPEGHAQLIKVLHKHKEPARVCMEATGTYHFDVAVALSKEPDIEVMVINPKASKSFADALMKRSKTDASTSSAQVLRMRRCWHAIANAWILTPGNAQHRSDWPCGHAAAAWWN